MDQNITISTPSSQQRDWLIAHDRHVDERWVDRCLKSGEYIVAADGEDNVGFLRFSWFWGKVPYMDMIEVVEGARRSGIGTRLLRHWEASMREAGASLLMTSAMSDEPEPQAWHKRNGFVESGRLTFGIFQQIPEIFMVKPLLP